MISSTETWNQGEEHGDGQVKGQEWKMLLQGVGDEEQRADGHHGVLHFFGFPEPLPGQKSGPSTVAQSSAAILPS